MSRLRFASLVLAAWSQIAVSATVTTLSGHSELATGIQGFVYGGDCLTLVSQTNCAPLRTYNIEFREGTFEELYPSGAFPDFLFQGSPWAGSNVRSTRSQDLAVAIGSVLQSSGIAGIADGSKPFRNLTTPFWVMVPWISTIGGSYEIGAYPDDEVNYETICGYEFACTFYAQSTYFEGGQWLGQAGNQIYNSQYMPLAYSADLFSAYFPVFTQIATVPLPAAAWLLAGALGTLELLKRRARSIRRGAISVGSNVRSG